MKKIIINNNKNIEKYLLNNMLSLMSEGAKCPVEGCGEFISFMPLQKTSGSAIICKNCGKSIVLKETEC